MAQMGQQRLVAALGAMSALSPTAPLSRGPGNYWRATALIGRRTWIK